MVPLNPRAITMLYISRCWVFKAVLISLSRPFIRMHVCSVFKAVFICCFGFLFARHVELLVVIALDFHHFVSCSFLSERCECVSNKAGWHNVESLCDVPDTSLGVVLCCSCPCHRALPLYECFRLLASILPPYSSELRLLRTSMRKSSLHAVDLLQDLKAS